MNKNERKHKKMDYMSTQILLIAGSIAGLVLESESDHSGLNLNEDELQYVLLCANGIAGMYYEVRGLGFEKIQESYENAKFLRDDIKKELRISHGKKVDKILKRYKKKYPEAVFTDVSKVMDRRTS